MSSRFCLRMTRALAPGDATLGMVDHASVPRGLGSPKNGIKPMTPVA